MRRGELPQDPLSVKSGERVGDDENSVGHVADHGLERLIEIVGLAHAQWLDRDAQSPGRRPLTLGIAASSQGRPHSTIPQPGAGWARAASEAPAAWESLPLIVRDAGEVAARSAKAVGQSGSDRIAGKEGHHRQGRALLRGERGG